MKDSGKITKKAEKAISTITMENFIWATGLITKSMDKECISIKPEIGLMETGVKI